MKELTEEEKAFIEYWKQNREKEKKWIVQLSYGLPLGLVFGLPIILSFLFRGWYRQMPFISPAEFNIVLIAVLGIAVFYGIFRMRHKWDMNELRYKELSEKSDAANNKEKGSL